MTWLLGSQARDVIDLGAGTGKLTAALVAAGHRVTAVEPSHALRAKLAAGLPEVRVVEGLAEQVPLPDRCADAVVVGQAFHWFDPAAAVAEVVRVLRPGGTLGLVWNFRDDSEPWMRELTAVAGEDGLPDGWAHELEALPLVASLERRDFSLGHPVDRDRLLALVRTWSYVSTLDQPDRDRVLTRVGELWERHPDLAGRKEEVLTYRTEAYRVGLGSAR